MGLSDEQKKRITASMQAFTDKQRPKIVERKRKNNSPEKEVVKAIMAWSRLNGFSLSVIEAKATYNPRASRYIASAVSTSGYCDISGNDKNGYSVYIEAKAKDRMYTLKDHQRGFLISKIKTNCFAGVFDSVPRLEQTYLKFISLPQPERQAFLLSQLPKKRTSPDDDAPLFDD